MKFFRFSNDRHTSKPNTASQQPMQVLESRRLMSLTGAVEYPGIAHTDVQPAQITHSFGFENHAADATAGLPGSAVDPMFPAQFSTPPDFTPWNADAGDMNAIEAEFAHAIAHGETPTLAGTAEADSSPSADSATVPAAPSTFTDESAAASLSALYSTLNLSTMAEIDAAYFRSVLDTLVATSQANVSPASLSGPIASVATPGSAVQIVTQKTTTAGDAAPVAAVTALSSAQSGALPSTGSATTDAAPALPPHGGMPSVRSVQQWAEAELMAVSNYAREAVLEMGRNMAIELAHLEADLQNAMPQMAAEMTDWKTATALGGAAIVTAVYLQSSVNPEKRKLTSVFSGQLIEAFPDSRGMLGGL